MRSPVALWVQKVLDFLDLDGTRVRSKTDLRDWKGAPTFHLNVEDNDKPKKPPAAREKTSHG